MASRVAEAFAGYSVEISRHVTRPHVANLVVRVRGGRPGRRLVFNGHLDTFPLVNADRWTKDPAGEVCGERLYGLGVSDMKGGVAAIVFAMRHLSQIRASLAGEIVATFVGDEESMGEEGTAWLLSNVAEATGDAMISADTGSPQILRFGEKGMIWLRLSTFGKSAHAAHVHKGISAIDRLLHVLHDIKYIEDLPVEAPDAVTAEILKAADVSERISGRGETEVLRKVTVTFGTIEGGTLPNLIADRATATADIRIPVGVSTGQVKARLTEVLARQEGVAVDIVRCYESTWTPPDHEIVQVLRSACRSRLGVDPVLNMRVGASDARLYRRTGVPSVVCGLTAYNMGAADEYVMVDELRALGEIYALTAFDYLAGPVGSSK